MTSLQDEELGRLKEEEDKKINEQYKDITNPKNPELANKLLGYISGTGLEVGAGYATDLATYGMLAAGPIGWAGYGITNFASGAASNWAAQKLRGEEEISWGEIISSGLIDIIPFFGQKLKGAKGVANVALQSGARTAVQRQGEVALDDQRWLTPRETLEAAALGGAFGAGFKGAGEGINLLKGKYRKYDIEEARELFQNPSVIQALIEQGRIHKVPKFARYYAAQRVDDSIDGLDPFWGRLQRLQESTDPADKAKYTEINEFLEGKVSQKGERYGGYFKQEEANEILKAKAEESLTAGRKVEGYRRVAGFLPLKDRVYPSGKVELGLESIARKHGYNIEDVHKYIIDQEEGNKYMKILISELNDTNRNLRVNKLNELFKIKEAMGKAGFRTTQPWYKTYKKLLKYAKENKYEWGHKESLWMMFVNELSGGNRVSNTFVQSKGNWFYTDFYGKKHKVKGNRSLGSRNDPPKFTLVKLQGSSENLEDDFIRYMMPMRSNTSIPDEYMEMADILYRKAMDKVKVNINRSSSSEDYYAELSRQSMAITQALHVMFKKADDIELPDWILEDDLLLKIPPKEVWKGLDPASQNEQRSLKNLETKFKLLRKLYTDTLNTLLEEL